MSTTLIVLAVIVATTVALTLWSRRRWLQIVTSAALFLVQFFALMRMMVVYRSAMRTVSDSGGPVREVGDAMQVLRDLQLPALAAVVVAGLGLLALVVFKRR